MSTLEQFSHQPWAASIASAKEDIHIYQRLSGNILAVIPATSLNGPSAITVEEMQANAQLIAKAPEMLGLLMNLSLSGDMNLLRTEVLKLIGEIDGTAAKYYEKFGDDSPFGLNSLDYIE